MNLRLASFSHSTIPCLIDGTKGTLFEATRGLQSKTGCVALWVSPSTNLIILKIFYKYLNFISFITVFSIINFKIIVILFYYKLQQIKFIPAFLTAFKETFISELLFLLLVANNSFVKIF